MIDVWSAQRCKKNMIHITTKFQWHCNQTWNIPSRRQHEDVTVFYSRVDMYLCFPAYVFVRVLWLLFQSSAAYTNSVHGASVLSVVHALATDFLKGISTNLWFFTAPQDFNWDIFCYYRWLYWWSTGCKKNITFWSI